LTYREVIAILMQRHVLVDGKVRTDKTYPSGFMGTCNSFFTPTSFMIFSCASSRWEWDFFFQCFGIGSRWVSRSFYHYYLWMKVMDEHAIILIFHLLVGMV
jgi:hypothetical protein